MDRRPYGQWEEKRDGARDWARAKAQDILKNHQPDPLDPKLVAELSRIIAAVERINHRGTAHKTLVHLWSAFQKGEPCDLNWNCLNPN